MKEFSLQFSERMIQPLWHQGGHKMVQLCLDKGQVLKKHRANQTLIFTVLAGKVRMTAGDEARELAPTQLVVIDALQEHEVEALEQSIALLTLVAEVTNTSKETEENHVSAHTNPELLEQISPELRPLVEDHMELCKALEVVHGPFHIDAYEKLFALIEQELNQHFVYEEEILFPRIAAHLGGEDVGPVPKLLKEHRQIKEMHAECAALLASVGANPSAQKDVESKAHQLANLLLRHIEKEDNHLFTMASRILSDEEKRQISVELKIREMAK